MDKNKNDTIVKCNKFQKIDDLKIRMEIDIDLNNTLFCIKDEISEDIGFEIMYFIDKNVKFIIKEVKK